MDWKEVLQSKAKVETRRQSGVNPVPLFDLSHQVHASRDGERLGMKLRI